MNYAPSKLIQASLGLHVFAAGAVVSAPQHWPFALAAVAANHAVLTACGLLPRNNWLGDNITQLPESSRRAIALTIDDGPDPHITPLVLALLAKHQLKATFFCIGERILQHPELAREIVRQGHDLQNHTQTHPHDFAFAMPQRMRREITVAQSTIETITHTSPLFFRAPAGLRNPMLDSVLQPLNLRLVSWTRRGYDAVSSNAEAVTKRLLTDLDERDILLLHDGRSLNIHSGTPPILSVIPELARRLSEQRLTTVTLSHAHQLKP
jgi:peptidoglycan-N-acetylglucosamine deacetylase